MQVHRAHEVDKRVPPRRNPQQTCNQKSSNQHTQTTAKNTHLLSFTVFFFSKSKHKYLPFFPPSPSLIEIFCTAPNKKNQQPQYNKREKKKKKKDEKNKQSMGIRDWGCRKGYGKERRIRRWRRRRGCPGGGRRRRGRKRCGRRCGRGVPSPPRWSGGSRLRPSSGRPSPPPFHSAAGCRQWDGTAELQHQPNQTLGNSNGTIKLYLILKTIK